jgi:hypothetical protein
VVVVTQVEVLLFLGAHVCELCESLKITLAWCPRSEQQQHRRWSIRSVVEGVQPADGDIEEVARSAIDPLFAVEEPNRAGQDEEGSEMVR